MGVLELDAQLLTDWVLPDLEVSICHSHRNLAWLLRLPLRWRSSVSIVF